MLSSFFPIFPALGVASAVVILMVATFLYAGDIHWSRLTVSMLCSATLPNGDPNTIRIVSVAGLVLLCINLAWIFELISRISPTKLHRKMIQIAGIASMVYALLTATPMHNLMVNLALGFYLVALISTVEMLRRIGANKLALFGLGCIAIKIVSASFYYSGSFESAWGHLQKLSFLLSVSWLITVQLTDVRSTQD